MRCLPDPVPRRGRWRRTRVALATAGAAALAAQLLPAVHMVLAALVAASWALIGLLVVRALASRYGLRRPAWLTASAVKVLARPARWPARGLAGRLRARQRPTLASPPSPAEQDCYELVGGPVGER